MKLATFDERVRQIAADAKGIRKWNEYRAATLRAGKAQYLCLGLPAHGARSYEGRFPIAYIDRAIFDIAPGQRSQLSLREAKIHTVIPTRLTDAFIMFHDPLPPRIARKSLRLFRQTHERLGGYCVVCSI